MSERESTRYAGVYRRSGHYQIVYVDSNGKQRFKALPKGLTAKEAHEARSRLIARMSQGEIVAPGRTTVRELWAEWKAQAPADMKPRTLETYDEKMRLYALPKLGDRKVSSLTVDDVARMIAELSREGRRAWTIRGTLVPLSQLFVLAVRRGLLPTNPVTLLRRSERPRGDQRTMRILSSDQIEALVGEASKDFRPLLVTLLFTGMRIGEALGLTWDDVDFEAAEIRVRDSKTAAGVRTIVMVGPVQRALATLSLERDQGLVFCTSSGRPKSPRNTLRSLHACCEGAGVERVSQHELRHTFASIMIEQRQDESLIAEQVGHSSTVTTRRVYGKLFDRAEKVERMREAFEENFGGMA